MATGSIYFIVEEDENSDYVKIGKARHGAEGRSYELQTGNPRKLTVAKSIRVPEYELSNVEHAFHALFEEYRVTTKIKSEWFSNATKILMFVKPLNSLKIRYLLTKFGMPKNDETRKKWYQYCDEHYQRKETK